MPLCSGAFHHCSTCSSFFAGWVNRQQLDIIDLELPPFRGRFTAWDSSLALQRLGACWAYPPLVVDG